MIVKVQLYPAMTQKSIITSEVEAQGVTIWIYAAETKDVGDAFLFFNLPSCLNHLLQHIWRKALHFEALCIIITNEFQFAYKI